MMMSNGKQCFQALGKTKALKYLFADIFDKTYCYCVRKSTSLIYCITVFKAGFQHCHNVCQQISKTTSYFFRANPVLFRQVQQFSILCFSQKSSLTSSLYFIIMRQKNEETHTLFGIIMSHNDSCQIHPRVPFLQFGISPMFEMFYLCVYLTQLLT